MMKKVATGILVTIISGLCIAFAGVITDVARLKVRQEFVREKIEMIYDDVKYIRTRIDKIEE